MDKKKYQLHEDDLYMYIDDLLSIGFEPVDRTETPYFHFSHYWTCTECHREAHGDNSSLLVSKKMTPKGSSRSHACRAEPDESSREPLFIQRGYHALISQGVIWLASSGLMSREVNSEKSAGSQYWASPAAWESSQAKPSFSRWSWKYESSGKNSDLYLWTSFKGVVGKLIWYWY